MIDSFEKRKEEEEILGYWWTVNVTRANKMTIA